MSKFQQLNNLFCKAAAKARIKAFYVFLAIFILWLFFFLAAKGVFDIGMLFNPCGFEQKYDLPCPTCGFTTAAIAFAEGRIFASFYIQPAAALFSVIIVITAIFSLITAVFGLYFRFLVNLAGRIKLRYIFLLILLIIIAGWSVTLARALAKNG